MTLHHLPRLRLGQAAVGLLCVCFIGVPHTATAWNNRGHMLVAQLAWQELEPSARQAAFELLQKHPHYEEFLIADKPDNINDDEWAFMRAAVWPDWVRSNDSEIYHKPTWHYINIPFAPEDSELEPPDNVPPQINIVSQISWCGAQVLNAPADKWKAVNLCWVLHLIGDIHQPLHCATLFSDQFPDGDKGGNKSIVRIGAGRKKLHSFWDGVLGKSTKVNNLRSGAQEIQALESADPSLTSADLANHQSPSSWAQEGFRAAVEFGYLNGDLEVANSDDHVHHSQIPEAPENYAENAGKVARIGVAKAGHRLAATIRQLVQ